MDETGGKVKITPGGARRIVEATQGWERFAKNGGAGGTARAPILAGTGPPCS